MAARERAETSERIERIEKSDAGGSARDNIPAEGAASGTTALPGGKVGTSTTTSRGNQFPGGGGGGVSAPGSSLRQRRASGLPAEGGPSGISTLPVQAPGSNLRQRRASYPASTQGKSGAGSAAAHDGSTMSAASAASSRGPRALIDFVTSLSLEGQLATGVA